MLPQEGFETWSPPESPLVIECGREAIEEIRRIARGETAAAGILYGTTEGRSVRVQTVRRIACRSAPVLQLSDADKAALVQQLTQPIEDPRLEALVPVGWFVSNIGGQISLSDSDFQLFSQFFHQPWQVTMVVRPGRAGNMRAGFFVRDSAGSVQRDHSFREFDFPDRLAWMNSPPAAPPERRVHQRRAFVPPPFGEAATEVPQTNFPTPEFPSLSGIETTPEPEMAAPVFPRRWPWLVTVGLALSAIVVYLYLQETAVNLPPPMDLIVLDRDGQLQIQWNRSAPTIVNAASGSIEVVDGLELKTIPLSAAELATGNLTYARSTGEVEVHLAVQTTSGQEVLESSRFLGRPPVVVDLPVDPGKIETAENPVDNAPPPDPSELDALRSERSALRSQLKQLRAERDEQATRIRQLELTMKIMQARVAAQ